MNRCLARTRLVPLLCSLLLLSNAQAQSGTAATPTGEISYEGEYSGSYRKPFSSKVVVKGPIRLTVTFNTPAVAVSVGVGAFRRGGQAADIPRSGKGVVADQQCQIHLPNDASPYPAILQGTCTANEFRGTITRELDKTQVEFAAIAVKSLSPSDLALRAQQVAAQAQGEAQEAAKRLIAEDEEIAKAAAASAAMAGADRVQRRGLSASELASCSPVVPPSASDPAATVPHYASAMAGDRNAQYTLGAALSARSIGNPSRARKAFVWLCRAAAQGDVRAMNSIGQWHYAGNGDREDFAMAIHWFELAAARGHALAYFNLGSIHERGLGTPANAAKALDWYQKAARAGDDDGRLAVTRLTSGGNQNPVRGSSQSGRHPLTGMVCSTNMSLGGTRVMGTYDSDGVCRTTVE